VKVLVTGGAGFIGSQLVDALVGKGHEVTVFDNLSSGRMDFLQQHMKNPAFGFVKGDLLEKGAVGKHMKGVDMVFHLAANPDARAAIRDTSIDLNLETIATYNVLEAMRRNDVRKIIFSSSGTVYGDAFSKPLAEDYGPLFPISLYGAGKLASEGLVSAFCGTFGFQAWIYRFTNIVGPRATHGVIYDFVNKLKANPKELQVLGNGTQAKPYLHVSDCVGGILFGLEHAKDRVNCYHLAVEGATSVRKIADWTAKYYGSGPKIIYGTDDHGWPGDISQVLLDTSKAKKLGWHASMTSDQAAERAVREVVAEMK
jgi:UDP-glucose 4-epimerase